MMSQEDCNFKGILCNSLCEKKKELEAVKEIEYVASLSFFLPTEVHGWSHIPGFALWNDVRNRIHQKQSRVHHQSLLLFHLSRCKMSNDNSEWSPCRHSSFSQSLKWSYVHQFLQICIRHTNPAISISLLQF